MKRHFGDSSKCFRHVEHISKVIMRCSTPQTQASSMIGRLLLGWYCAFEDYLCLLYASKHFLSREWREENVMETTVETGEEVLDSLWPRYWVILTDLTDLVCSPELKRWREVYEQLNDFKKLFDNYDIFKAEKRARSTQHSTCCPPPPFAPYFARLPMAGILRHTVLATQIYMRLIVYAPLRQLDDVEETFDETGWLAYELCRTFAGLEETFQNTDELIPIFPALTMAAFGCRRRDIRLWLWSKFAHYEELSQPGFTPIKKHLAVFWDMPDLPKTRFVELKNEPPDQQRETVNAESMMTIAREGKESLAADSAWQ